MVILDDTILSKVKSQLKEDVKPAVLIESLLNMAKNNQLPFSSSRTGSIASLMKNDVASGLEDPFDERATFSREEMTKWENEWMTMSTTTTKQDKKEGPLPLVVFVRTDACQNLLKSKSAVEYLQQECTSSDSIHLLVLGKGMDHQKMMTTTSTTSSSSSSLQDEHNDAPFSQQSMNGGGAPWFGFSSQNQNASGQNDPEGSRRFNIFLARTFHNGTPGIIGAIAPPQAGNLFPHLMAMQARERMMMNMQETTTNTNDNDESHHHPLQAELERWAQLLQQQQQQGGTFPPPQFFNASLVEEASPYTPSSQVLTEALQQAMTELLDRLAQSSTSAENSSDMNQLFAQILQNEHLRRGIAENLARAAPALTDPKCQGVMLSVYVPPSPPSLGKLFGTTTPANNNKPSGWFQKMLHSQETTTNDDASEEEDQQQQSRSSAAKSRKQGRSSSSSEDTKGLSNKAEGNLAKLSSYCKPISTLSTPSDPVRQKSWEAWLNRERGAVTFLHNRQALQDELRLHQLSIEQHTGTRGAGSALRQMLSFRDVTEDMENVIKCAVELEAAKSRRQQEVRVCV